MKKINQMAGAALVVAVLAVASVPAFGSTFTNAIGGPSGFSDTAARKTFVFEDVLDLADFALASNDVVQLFNIPSNCVVEMIAYRVINPTTNAFQFDVGDGDDADGWFSNIVPTNAAAASGGAGVSYMTKSSSTVLASLTQVTNIYLGASSNLLTNLFFTAQNSTNLTTVVGGAAYSQGKQYTANDTVDLTVDSAPSSTGKIHFAVFCIDASKH